MSPKKKRKLKHQTHKEVVRYIPHRITKGPSRRGLKKFLAQSVDIFNPIEWESENYEEVYT
jgi:hypothetical protein